jgi:hypothetical protein
MAHIPIVRRAFARVGASPVPGTVDPADPPSTTVLVASLPSILLAGILTGAAIAIGNGLVDRYVFHRR